VTRLKLASLVVVAASVAVWYAHARREQLAPRPADGVLVGAEPRWGAASIGNHASYLPLGHNEALPTGAIDITARVLARKTYPPEGFGDQLPLDLVLGWGPMSDNRVLDQVSIRQDKRSMQIDPGPGFTLKLDDAYASAINLSAYSDDFQFRSALESIRVGDVIRIVGWTLRLRNPQGEIWDGGDGQDHKTRRAVIVNVLKLQINDQKKFGNWDAETNFFPPQ
jgi:hypothetical protein